MDKMSLTYLVLSYLRYLIPDKLLSIRSFWINIHLHEHIKFH